MKLRILLWLAASAAAVIAPMAAPSQDKPAKPKRSAHPYENDPKEMMRRWEETLPLNEHHAKLAPLVGEWDVESRTSMAPGAPATKGSAKITWLMEGRWLLLEQEDAAMGVPMRTVSITGYDNFKLKYVSTFVNSYTTAMLSAEGAFDKDNKSLLQYGHMDEPMTGEHDKTVRYVTRFLGPDRFAFEIHDLAIGEGDCKVMEHIYTRRKP